MMRCVGPQTRGKSCVLAGADVMLHTGLAGVEMNRDPDKWKDYVGLPPDVYCDMDPAKEKDMVAFLAAHNTAVGAQSDCRRPRFSLELEAPSAGRSRAALRSQLAHLLPRSSGAGLDGQCEIAGGVSLSGPDFDPLMRL